MSPDSASYEKELRTFLDDRYGRSGKSGMWRWFATFFLIIGIPWLLWSAWHHANPESRTTVVSFAPIDDKSISITFELTRRDPSVAFLCTLIARDIDRNVVGEKDLEVPPSDQKIIRESTAISTRLRAVNADVLRCAVK